MQNYTFSSKPPRKPQEICKLSANYSQNLQTLEKNWHYYTNLFIIICDETQCIISKGHFYLIGRIGINRSQRHLFYYHTSTPIGSLPVRSRQLLRTKFSSFSTILRLFSLEAFQRRSASSLVNFVVSTYSSSYLF